METLDRDALREEVTGVTARWGAAHQALLDHHPDMLQRYHRWMVAMAADCTLSASLKHLIWVAVDAVPSHLHPRGIGSHAIRAVQHGATVADVFEAVELGCICSGSTFSQGLQIIREVLNSAGAKALEARESSSEASDSRARYLAIYGSLPGWLNSLFEVAPDYAGRLVDLAFAPRLPPSLDTKSRLLICLAVASCPAVADAEAIRHYASAAVANGATGEDLLSVLQLSSGIAYHSVSIGAPAIVESLRLA